MYASSPRSCDFCFCCSRNEYGTWTLSDREIRNAVTVESFMPELKSSADGCSDKKGELCVKLK